ncbi:MAG TPA: hypothetical protein VFW19_16705 [Allosphingosinicella sp.]|nr:hypothetical protein [Allosphingosinicella sp.]
MNRILTCAAAACFLLLGSAAAGPGPITISPGETVTARVADDSSGFVELSRGPAQAQDSAPAADTVRFTFTATANGRMLDIRNGYAKAFHFKAVMFRGSRSAPTSICAIPPQLSSFEMWPEPLDRLELSKPSLSAPGDQTIGCS